jgi:hypothetical protein
VPVCVIRVTRVYTHSSEDMASKSKRKRLNREDIVDMILDPDSEDDVCVCDQSKVTCLILTNMMRKSS